jgi:hypothetical protein
MAQLCWSVHGQPFGERGPIASPFFGEQQVTKCPTPADEPAVHKGCQNKNTNALKRVLTAN